MGTFDDLIPLGGGGKSGLSGVENKEMVDARKANQDGRDIFPALAGMYRVASRYPGGIPQAVYDKARVSTGSEAQTAQDYDLFNAYSKRAGIAQAKLLAPVSNTDLQALIEAGANPKFRFGNNQELIGLEYKKAAQKYFDNALKQRFGTRYGGTNARGPGGKSYAEVLSEAMRRPEVVRLLTPPWQRKGGQATKAKAKASAEVIDFNDLP